MLEKWFWTASSRTLKSSFKHWKKKKKKKTHVPTFPKVKDKSEKKKKKSVTETLARIREIGITLSQE